MKKQESNMNTYIIFILIHGALIANYLNATDSFESLFNKANTLFTQKSYAQAADMYRQAIAQDSEKPQAYFNLGVTLFELKQFDEAEKVLKKALALYPSYARAYATLGKIYKERKKFKESIAYFEQALLYDPKQKDVLLLIAEVLKEELRVDEALAYLEKALSYYPDDVRLEFSLANTLNMAGRTREALSVYLKINDTHPNDAGLIYNIAYTYKKLGMMKECLPYYDKALQLKPNHNEARFSQGLAYLVLGDFERGWEGYEHRWNRTDALKLRSYEQPQWDGVVSLQGKRIFVYAEQGLGDTFQFIRYLLELKKLGAYIIFSPQKPLMDILKLCPYIDEMIPFTEKPANFDYHIPLVSLPYILKTRIDTVPTPIPYLYADETLVEYWRKQLASDTNFRIGICWQGNDKYNTAFLRAAVAEKSMLAELFEPLTHIPGVTVYSLQYITGTDQLATLPKTMKLHIFEGDFDNEHGRFCDTAAVMKNLDLVVTIDTSICHLAAGLGVPVWNLLPNPPDWRWMLERNDTPWYPNMRLFRQPTPGDWNHVIKQVVTDIQNIICPAKVSLQCTTHTPTKIDIPVSLDTKKSSLEKPHIMSWGILLDTIARMHVERETSDNEQHKKQLGQNIKKLESLVDDHDPLPLIYDYFKTLCMIHKRCLTESDAEMHTLLEQMKEQTIQKINLLMQMH